MAYDGTSYNGDLIVDEYDDKNNFIGTETSSGFYVYHILGDSFDLMAEQCEKFMNDFSILSASASSLDKFWGVSYNMPRPSLPSGRELSDDEYRAYLYLRNCQLLTREDILINFTKCFAYGDYEILFSEETNYLELSDHLNYDAEDTISSNLHKRDDDTSLHFVTDFATDETTELIEGGLSKIEEVVIVINIPHREAPYGDWDTEFLAFLEQYISVKGNVKIKEYLI